MKKMKKLVATLVCLVVAIATLSACTSTGNGNTKPTEDDRPTEVVTTTEKPTDPTVEPTQEPTATEEPTVTETPTGDVIVPLYDEYKSNELHQMLNATFTSRDDINNLFYYTNFCYYFSPVNYTERRVDDNPDFSNLNVLGRGTSFEIIDPYTNVRTPLEISFYCEIATERLVMYAEAPNGISMSEDVFVPLWYNQTQGYFVGYLKVENNGVTSYQLYTAYWRNDNWMVGQFEGDPSLYGF